MQQFEKGKDKIQQICELLRHETIEPAKEQAKRVIEQAEAEAEKIIATAHKQSADIIGVARSEIERERKISKSALTQAAKQSIESLKVEIEQKLFNQELSDVLAKHMVKPQVIAELITSLIKAIERDGLSADFSAIIPAKVSPAEVNRLLMEETLNRLKNPIVVGDFAGGVKLQLRDKQITIDLSDKAVKEMVEKQLRKDFRNWLFG